MSQHDFDTANAAGAAFRSDLIAALQALATLSSGASAPSTTFARMLWADTTTNQLKRRNAANSAWVVMGSLDESFVLSRSSNTILGESDRGKVLIATGSFTQTLTAAATLGDGWFIDVVVDSGVTLTLDPNSTETIDGATTRAIVGPAQGRIVCNGTLFRTSGFEFVSSIGANGYIKFPGDLILQWGTAATAGTGLVTVTFPLAFSTALYSVFAVENTSAARTMAAISGTTSNFVGQSSSAVATTFSWLAIGK